MYYIFEVQHVWKVKQRVFSQDREKNRLGRQAPQRGLLKPAMPVGENGGQFDCLGPRTNFLGGDVWQSVTQGPKEAQGAPGGPG